ncbi:hypothetical protein BDQ94DRAFT_132868 [Aspergillus welwitschiae]|uniref:Uncharacterized protein n=1 Tax=Aspergillus welwitschiae TaxID=1341132 RepID=A0A3F3QKT7_9EURO|nr:hypothetical protein BDQ94DRAFT_132868 [Aspergillus welwitschiae]RDH39316.1 hypothetical protein BDQ94DRAFT_132868 [Aspergillus welwitschiae]
MLHEVLSYALTNACTWLHLTFTGIGWEVAVSVWFFCLLLPFLCFTLDLLSLPPYLISLLLNPLPITYALVSSSSSN